MNKEDQRPSKDKIQAHLKANQISILDSSMKRQNNALSERKGQGSPAPHANSVDEP